MVFKEKNGNAHLATYRLRQAMPGGPMLPRKVAFLIEHSTAVGDFTNVKSE
jgi:hypothetical protein